MHKLVKCLVQNDASALTYHPISETHSVRPVNLSTKHDGSFGSNYGIVQATIILFIPFVGDLWCLVTLKALHTADTRTAAEKMDDEQLTGMGMVLETVADIALSVHQLTGQLWYVHRLTRHLWSPLCGLVVLWLLFTFGTFTVKVLLTGGGPVTDCELCDIKSCWLATCNRSCLIIFCMAAILKHILAIF